MVAPVKKAETDANISTPKISGEKEIVNFAVKRQKERMAEIKADERVKESQQKPAETRAIADGKGGAKNDGPSKIQNINVKCVPHIGSPKPNNTNEKKSKLLEK